MINFKVVRIVAILAFIQTSFEFNVDVNKSSRSFIQLSNTKFKRPGQFFGNSFIVEKIKAGSR